MLVFMFVLSINKIAMAKFGSFGSTEICFLRNRILFGDCLCKVAVRWASDKNIKLHTSWAYSITDLSH